MTIHWPARLASIAVLTAVCQLPLAAEAEDALTCHGYAATIVGTQDKDTIVGTDGPDVIVSLAGPDRIQAGAGDDIICAGDGNDAVRGQEGDDQMWGEGGRDGLFGEETANRGPLDYAPGDDTIHGGDAEDWIDGGGGMDDLYGESGPDEFDDRSGGAVVHGGGGADQGFVVALSPDPLVNAPIAQVWGGPGNDEFQGALAQFHGGAGDDVITTGGPHAQADGGSGDDTITAWSEIDRTLRVSGGSGADQLVLSLIRDDDYGMYDRVLVDLQRGLVDGDPSRAGQKMRVDGFQDVVVDEMAFCRGPQQTPPVSRRYQILGTAKPNRLVADADMTFSSCRVPNMILVGRGGNDVLVGSSNADKLYGGPGHDRGQGNGGADESFSIEAHLHGEPASY